MPTMTLPSRNGLRSRLLAASAITAGFAFPAFAQNAAPADQLAASTGGLEEIVVTAQRREEKLHDVPIAVTAFNAATIESRGITSINGIAGFAPNVTIQPSPGYSTEIDIAIRGGVTINPAIYWEPTVGMYVDGVYVPKAAGDVFDVADIDDVATSFQDLNFIVEHCGLPRLDDFCWKDGLPERQLV